MRSNANLTFFALVALVVVSVAIGPAFAQTPAEPTASPDVVPTAPEAPTAPTAPTTPTNATSPSPVTPSKPPSFKSAFAPVSVVTSAIYGAVYGAINIVLIVGLVVLIACFKRRITKKPSKANAGAS